MGNQLAECCCGPTNGKGLFETPLSRKAKELQRQRDAMRLGIELEDQDQDSDECKFRSE